MSSPHRRAQAPAVAIQTALECAVALGWGAVMYVARWKRGTEKRRWLVGVSI